MLNRLRRTIREKGQGLTEYVLILAFIAGIAIAMFGSSDSLKNTVVNTATETVRILAGLFGEDDGYVAASQNYSDYFAKWRSKSSDELEGESQEERLKADREGLALIASYFLGKTQGEVATIMGGFTNTYGELKWVFDNLNADRMGPDENGWSQIMVPLSYWNANFDGEFNAKNGTGYYWLECSKNANLIKEMTKDVTPAANAGKNDVINYSSRSGTKDRVFYSNEMIGSNSSDRAVAMKVHYVDGKVDQVWIAAQTGTMPLIHRNGTDAKVENYNLSPGNSALNGNSTSIQGLDLTVTGSSSDYKYKVNS